MWPFKRPPPPEKTSSAIRFGILGAARVAPYALIEPASTHNDVVIAAVACRDNDRGLSYARKYRIPRTFTGPQAYQQLVTDPAVDAIYVALPNGLHFEWTMRALEAGKHVLVEKPMTNTPDEARQIFALAERKGLVALEALHSLFHPALHRVREIVKGGELGKVKRVVSHFEVPNYVTPFFMHKDDPRFHYDLGGGCTMDMGVYPLSAIRFITGSDAAPLEVTSASAIGHPLDPTRIDRGMRATFALDPSTSPDATAEFTADFAMPGWGPLGLLPRMIKIDVTVELEGGSVHIFNFAAPGSYHYIVVKPKGKGSKTIKAYTYGDGRGDKSWSSYRYQLEAFVDRVRGKTDVWWHEPTTVITEMETLGRIYEKAGMPRRNASSYKPEVEQNA